ncbi:MAG: IS3 family transposase [Cetobacterium sp.]
MKFEFIQVHSKVHSINILCKVCGVSRSGYYKHLASKAKRLEKEAKKIIIVNKIKKIHIDSRRAYGSPRIAAALNANGHIASKRLVAKLMKQNSIHAISHKKFRAKASPSKDSIEQNLIKDVVVTAPNQVWVTDITYIWTKKRWMYLSSIMDLYSRKIISHIINDRMDSKLVEDTLNLALSRRNWTKGLILHSDKGSQYRSKAFKNILKNHNIKQSMCGKGNCYDNAAMESFHSSLKKEQIYPNSILDQKETQVQIFDYIEGFYNKNRLHSSLNYVSPEVFERNYFENIS